MKCRLLPLVLIPLLANAKPPDVILDKKAVENLQLEYAEAEEMSFEETIFALGTLEVLPGKRGIVSSRIPGRAYSVLVIPHQEVEQGDEVAWVESRQPGDPPPTVRLDAPIGGLVSKVSIAQGQPISPDAELVEILDISTIEATAHVPQHLAGKLAKGQLARIRLLAEPKEHIKAKLVHIGVQADPEANTIEAAFHIPNPDNKLRPGMRVEFNIVVSKRENVMALPRSAIQGDLANRFVYVRDYELENAFVKAGVVVGAQNDQFVEIANGLLPGDEVVTKGAYALSFAGKGSVSLKEAMDAAHGHAHNEDGSEMTKDQADAEHDHDEHDHEGADSEWNRLTIFFAAMCGLLLALLLVATFKPREMTQC